MPHRYTHGHHESVLRSHTWRTAENSAGYLLPHLRPGMTLLDVGCGPGNISIDLAGRLAPGRVLGIDTSESVVGKARAAAAEAGSHVEFVTADLYAVDLPDDSFDVVHAHQVLQHLPDPVAALREMRRLAAPGGVVAVRDADYGAMTWHPAVSALDEWMSVYQQVARGNGGEPDAGRHLLGWAQQAGFDQVTPSASVWCFGTDEDRRWWGGMWADRILQSAIAEQAIARGIIDQQGLQRIADGWRDWVARPDGWFAVLHGEVLCRG
jgi:ubiquinone/menaquinone biosynthesis C-methylase UbiE